MFPWISKYSILLIPSLLIAFVIIIPGRITGGGHVFLPIVPVLVIIFIDLIERFKLYRKFIYAIALIGILFSLNPWFKWMNTDGSEFAMEMNKAVAAIKDDGSLTASTQFGPRVNRREEFFLLANEKMTDYVILKVGKNREKVAEIEGQELKYDQKLEASGLYRIVFKEERVLVYVKKDKIAELSGKSLEEIDLLKDEELQHLWKSIKGK